MAGEDSICSPIEGLFYSYKFYEGKWFGFSFIVGGYHFNMANWDYEEKNVPAGKVPVYPIYTQIGNNFYVVPVAGFEMNIGLYHWDKWSLFFNAVLTPVIIPTMISLKRTF